MRQDQGMQASGVTSPRFRLAGLVATMVGAVVVSTARGDALPPPRKTNSRSVAPAANVPAGHAVAKLKVTPHALVVTRKDGSSFEIPAGKDRFGDRYVLIAILSASEQQSWAILERTTESGVAGSQAGSIGTAHVLLSVEQRRFVEPEDLAWDPATIFYDFERKGGAEVVSYTTRINDKDVDGTIELATLEGLLVERLALSPSGGAHAPKGEEAPAAASGPTWTNKRHPVLPHLIVVGEEVIGGWSKKRGWIRIDHEKLLPKGKPYVERASVAGLVKKGTKLRLFKRQRRTRTVALDDLTFLWDGAGNQYVMVPTAKDSDVGLTGTWNPFLRRPRKADKQRLLPLVANLLKGQPQPPKGKPVVERAYQVDLDNDGADDFLVTAKGKDFWLAAVVWNKPAGERAEVVEQLNSDVSVGGKVMVLDANGDGKLELLLMTHVEGTSSTRLYELDAEGKAKPVLGVWNGC